VLAVADVFEAITSARPYRPARDVETALGILRADAPARLDGDAVEALAQVLVPRAAAAYARAPRAAGP
jgi:putative two-component system response regulator